MLNQDTRVRWPESGAFAHDGEAPGTPPPEETREADLKEIKGDYKELKREAKEEFKIACECAETIYVRRLEEARRRYLDEAAGCHDVFQRAKFHAREEYDLAMEAAKNAYELTVDIAKDQYKTLRKETTRVRKNPKKRSNGTTTVNLRTMPPRESAPTRIIMDLDREIRRIAAKKAAEQEKLEELPTVS